MPVLVSILVRSLPSIIAWLGTMLVANNLDIQAWLAANPGIAAILVALGVTIANVVKPPTTPPAKLEIGERPKPPSPPLGNEF